MTAPYIFQNYEALPPELQREAADFIEFLLLKWQRQTDQAPTHPAADIAALRRAGFGALKGQIWMSEDFDEPLDDFKEYM